MSPRTSARPQERAAAGACVPAPPAGLGGASRDPAAGGPGGDPCAGGAAGDCGIDALDLAARVEALTLRIDRVAATTRVVAVAGYDPPGRPSAEVEVEGAGEVGRGECVAWSPTAQARFAVRCRALLPPGTHRLGDLAARIRALGETPYERAAAEAAAVDLALRQAGANLFRLAGRPPAPVCFLLSFGTFADPARELRGILAEAASGARVKIDVDPAWPDGVFEELAGVREAVAVLDLKLRGDRRLAERAHAALPDALLEDPVLDAGSSPLDASRRDHGPDAPLPPSLLARIAFDGPVQHAADVEPLAPQPAAVNVKAPRMGGVLEALRAVTACRRSGIAVYVGGMFEVGPGRGQAQVLASLFSPSAWNDVAPLTVDEAGRWPSSPLAVPGEFMGLGFA